MDWNGNLNSKFATSLDDYLPGGMKHENIGQDIISRYHPAIRILNCGKPSKTSGYPAAGLDYS